MKRDNKIKVCRILAVVFLCFWTISGVRVLAQNATSILDKAASAYEDSNGLTAYFTMQTRSDVQKVSESFDGTVDIKGDKFVLKTPDMITWFDGTTQWSFVERNEEVNVSTPTGEELQATNPALLLRSYEKGFTAKYKGESTAPSGKAAHDIELVPKKEKRYRTGGAPDREVFRFSGFDRRFFKEWDQQYDPYQQNENGSKPTG